MSSSPSSSLTSSSVSPAAWLPVRWRWRWGRRRGRAGAEGGGGGEGGSRAYYRGGGVGGHSLALLLLQVLVTQLLCSDLVSALIDKDLVVETNKGKIRGVTLKSATNK